MVFALRPAPTPIPQPEARRRGGPRRAGAWALAALGLMWLGGGWAPAQAQRWEVRRRDRSQVFIKRYKRLLEGNPKMGYVFKRLLRLSGGRGGASGLIAEYRKRAAAAPQAWNLRVILGHLYRYVGKLDEAVQEYRVAREHAPRNFLAAYSLAEGLAAKRSTEAARKAYAAALELGRRPGEKRDCLLKLAALALREGKVDEAKRRLRAVLKYGAKNLAAREDLAALLSRYGLHAEALKEYEKIRRRIRYDNRKVALVLKEIGGLREKLGKPEGAIKAYRKALRLLSRSHWMRRELLKRIVGIHRRRGTLAQLAARYQKRVKRSRRDAEALFLLAQLYEELGREQQAVKVLRRALRLRPDKTEARLKLIDLLEGTQQRKEALKEYRRLVRRDPGNPEHRLRLARAYLRRADRAQAARTLRETAKRFSRSVPVLKNVADLYAKYGLLGEAIKVYRRLVKLDPGSPEHRQRLGDLFLARGDLKGAEGQWQRVLKGTRDKGEGHLRLARIYLSHGLIAKAIGALESAIEADPKDVEARLELARALGRARRTAEALEAWREVWRRATKARHLRAAETQLVTLYEQQGLLAETIVQRRAAFQRRPEDRRLGRLLGAMYQKAKDLLGAERAFRTVLKHHPGDFETMLDLERLLASRGDLRQARDLLVKAAKLDRRRAKQHYRRAIEYTLKAESAAAALELARKLVDLNPVDPEAHAQLGVLYGSARRLQDAIQSYRRAIQLAPQEFKYQLALGDLQRQVGKPREAHTAYLSVLSGAQDESMVLEATKRLMELAREQGTLTSLEKELRRICAANPKSMPHYQALAELYRSMGRTDKVDEVLLRASRRTTNRSSALGMLAAQAREKGDTRRAISYMRRQILESDKPSASQYRALAELYFDLGDSERAKGVIAEMIRTVGDKSRAYQAAAALYEKYQMPEKALQALALQVKYNPADLATKLKLARRYVETDRLREAEKLLWEVVDSAVSTGPSLGRPTPRTKRAPKRTVALRRRRPRFRFRAPWRLRVRRRVPAASRARRAAQATDLRREALGLLVTVHERWGNPDALTSRLEKQLAGGKRSRELLADLVAIYRLRGEAKKVSTLLKRGVKLFPDEPRWRVLLAQVELERGRWKESLRLYRQLETQSDPDHAREYALKRVQILLDRSEEKQALALIDRFLEQHRTAVGFLTRAAELLAGRGSFRRAVALLHRAGRDDPAARTLVRPKLVEYEIAAGRRKEAAKILAEALREDTRAPVSNPTGVYADRQRAVRRLFSLLDRAGRNRFIAARKEQREREPRNLLVLLDLHLAGLINGDEQLSRESLPVLLELGHRDKQLVSMAVERLVLANDFTRLDRALRKLFGGLVDAQERKRISEQALGHMRTHRRVPPRELAQLLTRAFLGEHPGPGEYRTLAQLYRTWGNLRRAAQLYEKALESNPSDAALYQRLGQLYRRMGQRAKARAVYRRAIARSALPAATGTRAGQDPYERARRRLRAVLRFYRAAGRVPQLRERLEATVAKTPKNALAAYELAAFYRNLGQRGRALATLEKLSRQRPKDPEVLEVLGRRYRRRGDYRTAARLFERSLKLGSFQKRALYRDLITCYRRLGRRRRVFDLERRMAWEMGDEFALYRLAQKLQRKGRVEEAIKAHRRYLSLKFARYTHLSGRRRSLRIALEMAKFLRRNKRDKKAMAELEGFLTQVRGLPVQSFERANYIRNLTQLYRRLGLLKQRLAIWEKRSRRDPFFLDLLYHYHSRKGHLKEKLRLLKRSVALRPRDETRIRVLAKEYARRGRYAEAIATLRRLKGVATTPEYLKSIGSLYHYQGKRKAALAAWRKYVESKFTYPAYRDFRSRRLFELAQILDKEGYRKLAENYRIQAVQAAAGVDTYRYGRIIGEYVRRRSYDAALRIALKAMEKVTDPQQRRNLLYALLPYGYYARRHLEGLRSTVESQHLFRDAEKGDANRAELAHLFYDILGERYRSANRLTQAAAAFEKALLYRDDADTLRNLVRIYRRQQRGPQLAQLYERLLRRRPKHAPYLRAAAEVYLKTKQYDRALPLLLREAQLKPSVAAYLRLVKLYRQRGQLHQAVPYLLKARKLAPQNVEIAERIEEVYRQAGAQDKLRAFYAGLGIAPKTKPKDVPRIARLLERGGRTYAAIEAYKLAFLKSPAGSWLRRQAQDRLTQALTRLGYAELAREDLLAELPVARTRAPTHERLARLLEQNGMPAKALAQLKRAAFLQPQRAELWQRGAVMAAKLGLPEEAAALVRWGRAANAAAPGWSQLEARLKRLARSARRAPRRILWRADLGRRCTIPPLLADGLVIAADCRRGHLVARGLHDGRVRWTFKLPPPPRRIRREGLSFEWRYRFTGLARGKDLLVMAVNEDQFESAPGMGTGRIRQLHLFAVRLADGEQAWHRAYPGDYAGGPVTVAGQTILVHGQNLRGFALEDGSPRWHAYAGSLAYGWIFDAKNITRPAASADTAFVAGRDGTLYAVALDSGRTRWKFRSPAPLHASPLATRNTVYVLGDDGYFYAIDARHGRPRWKFRAAADARRETRSYGHGYYRRPRHRGRPVVDQKHVYFATGGGMVYALDRRDGRRRWQRKLADRTGLDLALAGHDLFVAGERTSLYRLDARTGRIRWQYARPQGTRVSLQDGVLVALLGDGTSAGGRYLTAMDLRGQALWRRRGEALSRLATSLERRGDQGLLEALLRNVASPVDSDFRGLYLRLMRLRADKGDVAGLLKTATKLLRLRDGDGSWFPKLHHALATALRKRSSAASGRSNLRIPRVSWSSPRGFARALRRILDTLPVDTRPQMVPAELMLLASARSIASKLSLLRRLRAVKSPLATPFLYRLTRDPDRRVRSLAAVVLAESGDYSAKPALRQALQSSRIGLRRAAVLAIKKSIEPGDLPALERALADRDRTVRTEAALLVVARKRSPAARDVLRQALRGSNYELRLRAGTALGKKGDRQGLRALRRLVKRRRGPLQLRAADALYELGDRSGLPILLRRRQREAGAGFLSTVRLVLGNIYMLMEYDRAALLEYRSILSFDPDFDKAHANIGRLYYLRGRDAPAIQALNRALKANPFLALAQVYRGLARARLGDAAAGLKDIKAALAKDPTSKFAHLALAEVQVRRSAMADAERALDAALRRWPNHAPAHHHAARLRLGKAGKGFADLKLAERHARRALELRPYSARYLQTLAEVFLAQGKLAQALRYGRRAFRHAVSEVIRKRIKKFVARVRLLQEKGTMGS